MSEPVFELDPGELDRAEKLVLRVAREKHPDSLEQLRGEINEVSATRRPRLNERVLSLAILALLGRGLLVLTSDRKIHVSD